MNGRVVVRTIDSVQRLLIDELRQIGFALIDVDETEVVVDIDVVGILRQGGLRLSDCLIVPVHLSKNADRSHDQLTHLGRVLEPGSVVLQCAAILPTLLSEAPRLSHAAPKLGSIAVARR